MFRHLFVSLFGLVVVMGSQLSSGQVLPPVDVLTNANPSPGFVYLAPNSRVSSPQYAPSLMILDSAGVVVKSRFIPEFGFDFRLLPDGRLGYSVFQAAGTGPRASSSIYIVDTNLQTNDSLRGVNGYNLAMHSFIVLPNGNRLLVLQEDVTLDLTKVIEGGNPAATVQQMLIQEVDIRGNVFFQWRALDHFPVTVSYENLTAPSIRYFHLNAVDVDTDGNLLISARHASLVAKINRTTGNVMWILGGKLNQFTFSSSPGITDPPEFSYQHDVRRLPNGNLSLFDNGSQRQPKWSRGVEYVLDEVNKTCTLVWQYRHSPDLYAGLQGAMATLADGHRLVSWGSALQNNKTIITEVDAAKTVVFEAELPGTMFAYKAEKFEYPTGRVAASVLIDEILRLNTYKYTRGTDTVGLTVTYHTLISQFYNTTTAQRFAWSPVDPSFVVRSSDTTIPVLPPKTVYPCRISLAQVGMNAHAGEFRFSAAALGLKEPQQAVVYYRDSIGRGAFRAMRTRYNSASRELIVDTTWAGEFCFGSSLPGLPSNVLPPKLISPVAGRLVLANTVFPIRVSPQGSAMGNTITVRSAVTTDVVFSASTNSDKVNCTALPVGLYYWTASSFIQTDSSSNRVSSEESTIDSFVVEGPSLVVTTPSQPVIWWRDSGYVVQWTTNLVRAATIELIKNDAVVRVVADSVSASAGGFLWKVPATVPIGTGYSLRVRSRSGEAVQASSTTLALIEIREEPNSVVQEVQARRFFVAPNPAGTYFYIGGEHSIELIQLFSTSGEMVQSIEVLGTGEKVSLSDLPNGTYCLRIKAEGKWETQMLTVVK